jgi:8-oxo-dGTP pyrophosphatase MutT (NUDIX family)
MPPAPVLPGWLRPPRRSARVLLLDAADRVLLFRVVDPREGPGAFWLTPGGGVRRGESWTAAAARELAEETGLAADPAALGFPVARRRGWGTFPSGRRRVHDVFFVYRVTGHEVDTSRMEEHERGTTTGHRWWPVPELAASGADVRPPGLPDLLADVLVGRVTGTPRRLPRRR